MKSNLIVNKGPAFICNNDDPDVSNDAISTIVTLRENGIAECTLIANNYDGKLYLSALKDNDEIVVRFTYSEDALNDEEWNALEPVFKGNVIELNNTLVREGETLSVTAMGKGYCLKRMRVAQKYGKFIDYILYDDTYWVDDFTNETSEFDKVGSTPYLDEGDDDRITCPIGIAQIDRAVNGWNSVTSEWTHVNDEPWLHDDDEDNRISSDAVENPTDEYYTFQNLGAGNETIVPIDLRLKLKGRLYDGVGGHATSITVTAYLWDGSNWVSAGTFAYTSTSWQDIVGSVSLHGDINTFTKINNCRLKLVVTSIVDGAENKGGINLTWGRLQIQGYLPKEDYAYKTTNITTRPTMVLDEFNFNLRCRLMAVVPENTSIYIAADIYDGSSWVYLPPKLIDNTLTWEWYEWDVSGALNSSKFNDYKIKVYLYSVSGELDLDGTLQVSSANFYLYGYGYSSTEPYLRDILTDAEDGLITRYVEKILDTATNSGYNINTDYVYNDTTEFTFLQFPYQDAFMCIQDLIRLGSSLHYADNPSNWTGLHWIVTPDGELLIAPVGNHNVNGKNGSCLIENKWGTRINNSIYENNDTIVVKEDMILQAFKTEVPVANYVLVAGRFIKPSNEEWTEINPNWVTSSSPYSDAAKVTFDNSEKVAGNVGVKMSIDHGDGNVTGLFVYPISENTTIDFTKLIKKDSDLKVHFKFRLGGYTTDHNLVIMSDLTHFAIRPIQGMIQGEWTEHVINITYEAIQGNDDRWTAPVNPPDWTNIKYVGFIFRQAAHTGQVDSWVDDLLLEGTTIRGAYDSTSIKPVGEGGLGYGCIFKTIRDSLAYTDSLSVNDDTTPLALLALYELLRNRVVRISGQIQIPLDPSIKPGQLVHIHAAYDGENATYQINKDFRIISLVHSFTRMGAFTNLTLTDDLKNSIPINSIDPYSIVLRAVNPDYQTRTFASLKTGGDFVVDQVPVSKDYPS